jgi:beta-galactosidase
MGCFIKFQGVRLLAVGMPLICFGVSHYPVEDFDNGPTQHQSHITDLKKGDWVVLNIDYKQMGVGGDTCWGAKTHDEYMLFSKPYSYKFRLRPYSVQAESPTKLSKQVVSE